VPGASDAEQKAPGTSEEIRRKKLSPRKAKTKKQDKTSTIKGNQIHDKDTGSSSVQIALLTERINNLTSHFKVHKKDVHSRQGLIMLVNKRRRLLDYLKKVDQKQYKDLVKKLSLRK